jgi:hypothetical protein
MAIRSKPRQQSPAAQPNEKAVEAFISRGGQTPTTDERDQEVRLQLRPMRSKVSEIDRIIKAKYPNEKTRPSRHSWIMTAIDEKIERDE